MRQADDPSPNVNLISHRINRGLSLRQAAIEMNVSLATLSRAEQGRRVSEASAKRIADFYGMQAVEIRPALMEAA